MQFGLVVPAGQSYVDLALCASIMNRRGYKQQDTTWVVGDFEVFQSAAAPGLLRVSKLPETWVFENAYTKSRALWDQMNEQVLETEPDIQGRYADFKIGMNPQHVAETVQCTANPGGKILTPQVIDNAGVPVFTVGDFTAGAAPIADWDFSKLQIPNDPVSGTTSEYTLHAVGGNTASSKGLIAGYQLSRARPNQIDPNVPVTAGWMNDLFDDGEQLEEIRGDLNADNDRAPYPVGGETTGPAFYPGGNNELNGVQLHSFCNFTTTTVSGKNSIRGGMFNLGLLEFDNTTGGNLTVIIHMVPGDHRGYLCERM